MGATDSLGEVAELARVREPEVWRLLLVKSGGQAGSLPYAWADHSSFGGGAGGVSVLGGASRWTSSSNFWISRWALNVCRTINRSGQARTNTSASLAFHDSGATTSWISFAAPSASFAWLFPAMGYVQRVFSPCRHASLAALDFTAATTCFRRSVSKRSTAAWPA